MNQDSRVALAAILSLGILVNGNHVLPLIQKVKSLGQIVHSPPSYEYPRPSFLGYDPVLEEEEISREHSAGDWNQIYAKFAEYLKHPIYGLDLIQDIAKTRGIVSTYLLESTIWENDKDLFFKGASILSDLPLDKDTSEILNYFALRAKTDWSGLVREVKNSK